MKDRIYLDLPTMPKLKKELSKIFDICSLADDADVVIAERSDNYIHNSLLICISSDNAEKVEDVVYLSDKLRITQLIQSIKISISTYSVLKYKDRTSNRATGNTSEHDATVEYFISRLENILNSAPESIIEVDVTGAILFHNVKFSQIYDPDCSIIEGNIFDIFDAETSAELKKYMSWELTDKNTEFIGKLVKKNGLIINIIGHITALAGDNYHFEIIFDDITSKIAKLQKMKKIEEQSIVAGFARHLSHNVMNALTAAGGFIRQIKAKTENNLHTQNVWRIIDEKLSLIEEVVAAYNDFTHATSLITNEKVELYNFFKTLMTDIKEKRLDRNFSAYLYKFTDFYNMECDFSKGKVFESRANKMFLKLAVCYILKDCIRYFGGNILDCSIKLENINDEFLVIISIKNVDVSDNILSTMFRPWDHQMLTQSFDYWGIVIAGTIMEKHNGKAEINKQDNDLNFILKFFTF